MAKGTDDAFTKTGFDNWKRALEKFASHSRSQLHHEAVMKWKLGQQPGIDAVMGQAGKAEQTCHREMLIKQLESLRYLLKQGLAVRGHEEADGSLYRLLLLRSGDCPELNAWLADKKYFSPDILNEQISIMGQELARSLLQEIRKAVIFSVIADEATHVSNKEQLCICIRWVGDDFSVNEDFLEMIPLPKTDSNTVTLALKDSLVQFAGPPYLGHSLC
jgi:hypothetical protein